MSQNSQTIARLNDELRKDPKAGIALITPGVAALGADAVARIFRTIAIFDDFYRENDPHSERDFGALDAGSKRIFFKIDYYNLDMSGHSPDPTNPALTKRVIAIMLAGEY